MYVYHVFSIVDLGSLQVTVSLLCERHLHQYLFQLHHNSTSKHDYLNQILLRPYLALHSVLQSHSHSHSYYQLQKSRDRRGNQNWTISDCILASLKNSSTGNLYFLFGSTGPCNWEISFF